MAGLENCYRYLIINWLGNQFILTTPVKYRRELKGLHVHAVLNYFQGQRKPITCLLLCQQGLLVLVKAL